MLTFSAFVYSLSEKLAEMQDLRDKATDDEVATLLALVQSSGEGQQQLKERLKS